MIWNILLWPFKAVLRVATFGLYNPWKSKNVSEIDNNRYYNAPMYLSPGADYKAAKKLWQKVFGKNGENMIVTVDGLSVENYYSIGTQSINDISDFDFWLNNMYRSGCCGSLNFNMLVIDDKALELFMASELFVFGPAYERDFDLDDFDITSSLRRQIEEQEYMDSLDDHWQEFVDNNFEQDRDCNKCGANVRKSLTKEGKCGECNKRITWDGWVEKAYPVWYRNTLVTPDSN